MGASVRQAHHDRPLSAAELELLRAVPAGACLPPAATRHQRPGPQLAGSGGGHRGTRAAYTRLGSGRITTVAAGTGPHLSFSVAPSFNSPRWGDYSFAQPDPDGYGVWLATEYIPPAADQDPMDNWGTYVFEVK